jgi:hypothetical protein
MNAVVNVMVYLKPIFMNLLIAFAAQMQSTTCIFLRPKVDIIIDVPLVLYCFIFVFDQLLRRHRTILESVGQLRCTLLDLLF